jgi:hypothetical protein
VELTPQHPLSWMNDLWRRFHGLERPEGPNAEDAVAIVAEVTGSRPSSQSWRSQEEGPGGFRIKRDAIGLVRRRLCLTADRDAEIEDALGDRLVSVDGIWSLGRGENLVTLWWDTRR